MKCAKGAFHNDTRTWSGLRLHNQLTNLPQIINSSDFLLQNMIYWLYQNYTELPYILLFHSRKASKDILIARFSRKQKRLKKPLLRKIFLDYFNNNILYFKTN